MWLSDSLGAFFGAVFFHALLCRFPLRANRVLKFLIVGVPIGFFLTGLEIIRQRFSIETFAAVFLFAFLCELYIFVFSSIIASVSLSLLLVLHESPRTSEGMDEKFSSRSMVRWRLAGLVREGFLMLGENGYIVTKRGLLFVRVFRTLQDFFGHSKSPDFAPRSSKA